MPNRPGPEPLPSPPPLPPPVPENPAQEPSWPDPDILIEHIEPPKPWPTSPEKPELEAFVEGVFGHLVPENGSNISRTAGM
jgi:hypothetical protein